MFLKSFIYFYYLIHAHPDTILLCVLSIGAYRNLFDGMVVQDADCSAERDHWRSSDTGKYILNFYAENRGRIIAKT